MGRQNFKTHTCIAYIVKLCPNDTILLLLRDGRDVACSIRDRTGSIKTGIIRWVEDNRAGRELWSHPSVYVFKYESLLESCESTVKDVLDFLGEEYENGVKAYHKTPRYYYSNKIEKPETAFGKNHDQYRNCRLTNPYLMVRLVEADVRRGNLYCRECGKRNAHSMCVCRIKEIARIEHG